MTAEQITVDPVLLRAGGTAVLLDVSGPSLPRVLHWGADPGPLNQEQQRSLAADLLVGGTPGGPGQAWPLTLIPGEPELWSGWPGVRGHRVGAGPFPRWQLLEAPIPIPLPGGGVLLSIWAADADLGLSVECLLRLEVGGLLRVRHRLTNTGKSEYTLDGLTALLPVPAHAEEVLDLTGHWCREHVPQRAPFQHGTRLRASRRGRTGHDATLLLFVGTPGFGFRTGEVWGVHVAWSGDHLHLAEQLPEGAGSGGRGVLGGGELLLPGEVRLGPGEMYETPWVAFTWSDEGLDGASARVHRWLRSRPQHPARPRPLVLNTWEAVYFDHDLAKLTALAERAAEIGVERFVLDDGWFMGRRDDTAGLGDWYVDPAVWPQGLQPLADRVRELGMEFGLWVEPEMVNPDSDLVRAHPDWVLAAPGRWPRTVRDQLVLNVAHPDAWAYLLERLDALIQDAQLAYLKWDHNRDLHESVLRADQGGGAGVHAQTLSVYALLDELRRRHPLLEIESCASGGGRVDLGILERTDRVWGSDTNDPLERQAIQRWTGLLVPPELVGAHVGPPLAHTTGRVAQLAFRCVTALFGHAGLEWDVTTCSPQEMEQLRDWAGLYRELRPMLHSGDVVRADHPDDGTWLHGVVSTDRSQAVFGYVRMSSSADALPARLRFPGLEPNRLYRVGPRQLPGGDPAIARFAPAWWVRGHATATGAVLERVGLPAPVLDPERAVLLHLRAAPVDPAHGG